MEKKFYHIKGNIDFYLCMHDRLEYNFVEFEDTEVYKNMAKFLKKAELEEFAQEHKRIEVSHLMDASDFIFDAETGCLTDYDGYIENVFVDGYISNLSIYDKYLHGGKFNITLDKMKELSNLYEVKVDWVNK